MSFVPALSALAIILIASLVGGRLAGMVSVPRVTGYLVMGLLFGPSFAHLVGLPQLIASETLTDLRIISQIALSLIMLSIGGQFRAENLRRWRHRIGLFSLGEIATTFLLVGVATFSVNLWLVQKTVPGLSLLETSFAFAAFLAIIAVATAPAATLMVIREYQAEGPVTNTVLTLVGLNNLASVLGFVIVAHLIINPDEGLTVMVWHMGGPILLGGAVGFALSVWVQRLQLSTEHKILMLAGAIGLTGLCQAIGLDPLLASLAMGVVLANSSPQWHKLVDSLRQIDYPLYVAFFFLAGANLHLETLAHIGALGVAYVVARTLGKLLGAKLGAALGQFGKTKRDFVGFTLFAQAGVAIGLASTLAHSWPVGGKLLETVVLGSVVVFELFGPLAVRRGLVQGGEVPILSLLTKRAPQGAMEGLHSVVSHFRSALGMPAGHDVKDPGDILVKHIMRQNVETIPNSTPFNELLRLIAHSRYDRFPVVDKQGHFVGMIDYAEISNFLFEPSLSLLVVANDLASSNHHAVGPEQPLREVLKTLQGHKNVSYFPVIDPQHPDRLLGVLSQNDVLSAFRRLSE